MTQRKPSSGQESKFEAAHPSDRRACSYSQSEGYHGGVTSRKLSVGNALASVRAEGLEPEPAVVELLERWGRGELTDVQLEDARKDLASHGTLTAPVPLAR